MLKETALKSPDPALRKAALYAIGEVEGKVSFGMLKDIFESTDDTDLQKAALYAIENTDDPGWRISCAASHCPTRTTSWPRRQCTPWPII
ncbi:MAG: HEAT repeat domain-containing protein [Calditrichae bacterium]|nr:HEAT repeat domain-containing protein [Calditrichia bacterium]